MLELNVIYSNEIGVNDTADTHKSVYCINRHFEIDRRREIKNKTLRQM
jgi:hypothetical protein